MEPIRKDEAAFVPPQRIELDITEQLAKLFGGASKLIKDLCPDQIVCTACAGLGITRFDNTYGLKEDPGGGFPYTQDGLLPCPACWYGVRRLCSYCGKAKDKRNTNCDCKESRAARDAESKEKEQARRAKCKRIALADYKGDMLYDADRGEYVHDDDEDLDPTHTYFACTLTEAEIRPTADDVIERMNDEAGEMTEDDFEVFTIGDGGEEKLQELLNAWMKECVKLGSLWWSDEDVIVEVPAGEAEGE